MGTPTYVNMVKYENTSLNISVMRSYEVNFLIYSSGTASKEKSVDNSNYDDIDVLSV